MTGDYVNGPEEQSPFILKEGPNLRFIGCTNLRLVGMDGNLKRELALLHKPRMFRQGFPFPGGIYPTCSVPGYGQAQCKSL